MRIRVEHEIRFTFDAPVRPLVHLLRVTPRHHDGQHVASWQVDVDVDCRLKASEDAFGNFVHAFTCDGTVEAIGIRLDGEIEAFDAAGMLRGTVERLPPELYLRDTALTVAAPDLRSFAEAIADADNPLGRMHALLAAMKEIFSPCRTLGPRLGASEIFKRKQGDATDLAHVFIAAARHQGVPARFVAGYCASVEAAATADAAMEGALPSPHAWAEAYLPRLGWIGFDPSTGLCPQDTHVRVAVGLDGLDAAPVRAARQGSADERFSMTCRVSCLQDQVQV